MRCLPEICRLCKELALLSWIPAYMVRPYTKSVFRSIVPLRRMCSVSNLWVSPLHRSSPLKEYRLPLGSSQNTTPEEKGTKWVAASYHFSLLQILLYYTKESTLTMFCICFCFCLSSVCQQWAMPFFLMLHSQSAECGEDDLWAWVWFSTLTLFMDDTQLSYSLTQLTS